MNKIIVEISVGELLDKISILEIKQEKIKDPEKLKFISDEHSVLNEQFDKNVKSDDTLNNLFQTLRRLIQNFGSLKMTRESVKNLKTLMKNLLIFQEMFIFLMTIELKLN